MQINLAFPALFAVSAASVTGWLLDAVGPDTPKVIVPAIIFSLGGGTIAAFRPWGTDPRWGPREALKAVAVGVGAGVISGLFLAGMGWFAKEPEGRFIRLGIEATAGYLGQQFFQRLDELGPAGILNVLLRRQMPAPPSVVPKGDPP